MQKPAVRYLTIRSLGAPAVLLSLAMQGVFRGFKDTKTPLYATGKNKNTVAHLQCRWNRGAVHTSDKIRSRKLWNAVFLFKIDLWSAVVPLLLAMPASNRPHISDIANLITFFFSVVGDAANIILDPILMFVCHMGVTGAAIAHVVSQ